MRWSRRRVLAAAAVLAAPRVSMAQAAAWPNRTIRIIVPTAPGGSPDVIARLLGSNQVVAKSEPDGHTLAMLTGGFTAQAAVMKSLPYDPLKDFAFVTSVVAYPMIYGVVPNSSIASFKDLVDRAKASP